MRPRAPLRSCWAPTHHRRRARLQRVSATDPQGIAPARPALGAPAPAGTAWVRGGLPATEEAADEAAARRRPRAGLDLADALLKVARLVPRDQPALVPALALHNGDDIARRVGRLLQGPASAEAPRRTGWALAGLTILVALPLYPPFLHFVHDLTERLLAFLS